MKYELKGIIRGAVSELQHEGFNKVAIEHFESDNLHDLLEELLLDEWIFILKVNGRRIKNPLLYIRQKGLDPDYYTRAHCDAQEKEDSHQLEHENSVFWTVNIQTE